MNNEQVKPIGRKWIKICQLKKKKKQPRNALKCMRTVHPMQQSMKQRNIDCICHQFSDYFFNPQFSNALNSGTVDGGFVHKTATKHIDLPSSIHYVHNSILDKFSRANARPTIHWISYYILSDMHSAHVQTCDVTLK